MKNENREIPIRKEHEQRHSTMEMHDSVVRTVFHTLPWGRIPSEFRGSSGTHGVFYKTLRTQHTVRRTSNHKDINHSYIYNIKKLEIS